MQVKMRFSLVSIFAMSLTDERASPTESYHIAFNQSAGSADHHCLEDASRCIDTCNIVVFGEIGAGKSSLVNLIAGTKLAQTSSDAGGCTTDIRDHVIKIQNRNLEVKLFDTVGLGEGSHGVVPDKKARNYLEDLLRRLMKTDGIHLLMYCVQGGTIERKAFHRNYQLLPSNVKGKVPIIIVVTGLEDREPEMEEWWRDNEKSISDLGMIFDGHACITAITIDNDDADRLKRRCEQSYDAIFDLIEKCRARIPPARKTKNIVLFGEAGAGKSSIVNLMAGREVAPISPGMQRCTLHWQDYSIDFDGESYQVFDTIGLEESGLEMNEYLDAVRNAYRLIKALNEGGGVHLLLFCIRAGRLTAALQHNYQFFHEFLCEKKVPTVLAITNLEREKNMEDWWEREHQIFERCQIHVTGHACITAANGLDGRHQQLYEESRVTIRDLVKKNIANGQNQPWTGGDTLFVSLVRKLKKLIVKKSRMRRMNLAGHLRKHCGMSREAAKELANMVQQDVIKADVAKADVTKVE
ncbi:P-loop containing nucleoside triphosphate hydrolase protein [Suillus paluster]|uniref:P-loop containing nucleoside triphosphate hydrolase protein n=1 Tax=Suillus paluster TaxID=48578 RepID=UPI001B86818B|nr:P-loop containing nucleoside triphosphate hydrolase protein [Suillus paluster]KAG1720686.1 P-loop containing nucleoside triphosphate hydrolase protein [Suillus paluster]